RVRKIDATPASFLYFVRIDFGPADCGIELTADSQHGVADDFRFHAAWVHAPKINVLGISLRIGIIGFASRGAHPVSLRSDDQAMNALHAPAALHELHGEPVEQLRMRRQLAVLAEISNAGNDRAAEMTQPDMVHCNSRGKRIFTAGDPTREGKAASTGS